jgi:hypothetical protein
MFVFRRQRAVASGPDRARRRFPVGERDDSPIRMTRLGFRPGLGTIQAPILLLRLFHMIVYTSDMYKSIPLHPKAKFQSWRTLFRWPWANSRVTRHATRPATPGCENTFLGSSSRLLKHEVYEKGRQRPVNPPGDLVPSKTQKNTSP